MNSQVFFCVFAFSPPLSFQLYSQVATFPHSAGHILFRLGHNLAGQDHLKGQKKLKLTHVKYMSIKKLDNELLSIIYIGS